MQEATETPRRPLALVTGASSGIGKAIAFALARRGHDLIAVGRSEALIEVAHAIAELGVDCTSVRADLSTRAGVAFVARAAAEHLRPLDVAVLNAGASLGGPFHETPLDAELDLLAVNVEAVVHLAKRLVPAMVDRGEGRIMLTSSVAALVPGPFQASYAASKAFVQSFGVALRNELADHGVSVTVLMPGPTETPIFHRAGMDDTRVGGLMPKADPDAVAREAVDGLLEGRAQVVPGGLINRLEVTFAPLLPDALKATLHRQLTEPGHGGGHSLPSS